VFQIICRTAANDLEKEQAMTIRRKVFVEEQGLFPDSDQDEHDQEAVHLVADVGGKIVGTVRLYCQEKNVWVGGRLAVLPPYRGRIGAKLVEKAVQEAEKRGAEKFIAYVQVKNERFFHRLGWRTTGGPQVIYGQEHILMEAPMGRAARNCNFEKLNKN